MGVWEKIEAEDMTGSGNGIYFKPGTYPLLQLKEAKFKPAEDTYKKSDVVIFILEVMVDTEVYKKGTLIEYVVKERKSDGEPNTFYLKNIKKFLMACFDTDDHTEINEKVMNLTLGEKQKANGSFVSAIATNIKIGKQRDKDFTDVAFKYAGDRAKEAAAQAV